MGFIEESIAQLEQAQRRNIKSERTTITTAQMLALNATPITVVAAPALARQIFPLGSPCSWITLAPTTPG